MRCESYLYISPHHKPYLVASLSVVAEAMLSRVLEEAVNRIARKVAEGKKISDQEIVILYLDIIMRSNERRFEAIDKRFNDLKEYVDKRINDLKDYVDKRFEAVDKRLDSIEKRIDSLERRVELVYNEVSSIKTDIIKMMKEYMERLYGGKKG
jgi:archaellum component FlaC